MKTNKEIAADIDLLGKLYQLHDLNDFKAKALLNSAFRIKKAGINLLDSDSSELLKIDGISKSILEKLEEIKVHGHILELQSLLEKTPVGIAEMFKISGLGPSKIKQLWKEADINSMDELYSACLENRLINTKGFGQKTQDSIKDAIDKLAEWKGQVRINTAQEMSAELVSTFKKMGSKKVILVGEIARICNTISELEFLTTDSEKTLFAKINGIQQNENDFRIEMEGLPPVIIHFCDSKDYEDKKLELIGPKALFEAIKNNANLKEKVSSFSPELRDLPLEKLLKVDESALIKLADIKGVIHSHTTWSDGVNSTEEMAIASKSLGYEYILITDHSKSAFYANGLSEERIILQHKEIDKLNQENKGCRIFKGIEADILNDGSLDYSDEVLASFDLVIASVHSNLKMDEEKAMMRLLKAIENPYTNILGHMTGRLILSREGYPVNHKTIIDACAKHNVAIEINANPYRLDIDHTWIPYCMERGVDIFINPDAHSIEGISDIKYGVNSARKGALWKEKCINTLSLPDFENYIAKQKSKRK